MCGKSPKGEHMTTDSLTDESLFKLAKFIYVEGRSQKEAAELLQVSPSTVSRAIQQCRDSGLIQVIIHPPQNVALTQALMSHAPSTGIREFMVVHGGREGVGQRAAGILFQLVNKGDLVVLDGGQTISEIVLSLPSDSTRQVSVAPIAADPASYDVSAYEMMAIFRTRFRLARSVRLPHRFSPMLKRAITEAKREAKAARFVFIGAGPWSEGHTAQQFVHHLGIDPKQLTKRYPQIAAVAGYVPLDSRGRAVKVADIDKELPRALGYRELRTMAGDPEKVVVLVASGASKVEALRIVMKARIVNRVILDVSLAKAILERGLD